MAKIFTKKKDRSCFLIKEVGNQPGRSELSDGQDVDESTTDTDRIRLSCDITRAQHRKLRMEAARTDRTLLQVVQDMIATQFDD